jgi:hypothetical protein
VATDIDKFPDYSKLVSKINSTKPNKAIVVFIDEQEIKKKKLPKVRLPKDSYTSVQVITNPFSYPKQQTN